MIIDATNLILGRVATIAAKKALLGEKIDIVNCEKSMVTGNKNSVLESHKVKANRGTPAKGPFIPKRPDRFVKRAIRGMLPYKRERGRTAFERIKCHIGVPEELKNQKLDTIKEANISKLPNPKYISVDKICKSLGFKIQ